MDAEDSPRVFATSVGPYYARKRTLHTSGHLVSKCTRETRCPDVIHNFSRAIRRRVVRLTDNLTDPNAAKMADGRERPAPSFVTFFLCTDTQTLLFRLAQARTIVGGGLDCDSKASIVVLSFFVFGCGIVAEASSLQDMLIIPQTELHCSERYGVNGVGAVLQ